MSRIERSTKLLFITIIALALIFFLHFLGILQPLERGTMAVFRPVLGVFYQLSNKIGGNYLEFKSKQELIRENKDLKDQLQGLLLEKSKFYTEKEENDFLREQLNFAVNSAEQFVIADVIGRGADNSQSVIIINRGENDGLRVGQPVLADGSIMVAKISRVSLHSAQALLINDDLSSVAAKIHNKAKTMGLVQGEYGLGMKMKLIPQSEVIKENDVIVSSGLETLVPAGLLIGTVDRVLNEPENLFQEASLKSLIDFNKITMVSVVTKNNVE